jgi:hypothetical protein
MSIIKYGIDYKIHEKIQWLNQDTLGTDQFHAGYSPSNQDKSRQLCENSWPSSVMSAFLV